MTGTGHSSCLPAQRPSLGVMLNPYAEPVTGPMWSSALEQQSARAGVLCLVLREASWLTGHTSEISGGFWGG